MHIICTQCISTCQCEQVQRFKAHSEMLQAAIHPSSHYHSLHIAIMLTTLASFTKCTLVQSEPQPWCTSPACPPTPPPSIKSDPASNIKLQSLSSWVLVSLSLSRCLSTASPISRGHQQQEQAPAARAGGPGDFIQFNSNWLIIHWMIYWPGAKPPPWSSCCAPHSCCSASWSWFRTKSQAVCSTGRNIGTVESGCSWGCEDYWQKIRRSNAHGSCVQLYLLTDVNV